MDGVASMLTALTSLRNEGDHSNIDARIICGCGCESIIHEETVALYGESDEDLRDSARRLVELTVSAKRKLDELKDSRGMRRCGVFFTLSYKEDGLDAAEIESSAKSLAKDMIG